MFRRGRHRSSRAVLLGALALGLLIWAKLRLVTTIPRSALAEPETSQMTDPRAHARAPEDAPKRPGPGGLAEVPGTEPAQR